MQNDADETEGRRLYRAKANALVRWMDGIAKRRVRMIGGLTRIYLLGNKRFRVHLTDAGEIARVEVWRRYLSDKTTSEGHWRGYWGSSSKKGDTPLICALRAKIAAEH